MTAGPPGTENAAAETEAGSSGSSTVTATRRPSRDALASTRVGPVTSGANWLFCSPGVPPSGSVVVAQLAATDDGPAGSLRSSDASRPPHDGS